MAEYHPAKKLISSVYGKPSNPQAFIDNAIEEGRIEYYNKKAARTQNRLSRVKFPRGVQSANRDVDIFTPADFVKEIEANPSGAYLSPLKSQTIEGVM